MIDDVCKGIEHCIDDTEVVPEMLVNERMKGCRVAVDDDSEAFESDPENHW